jgi:phosphoglycerate dehydrogenase-like enzyme
MTHHLLILSKLHAEYQSLILAANVPDLIIHATADPAEGRRIGAACDILFGEPSLIVQVINDLPALRWVQCAWAGVEPMFKPGMRRDYLLTNVRGVFGPQMSEFVFGYLLLLERRILSRWQSQQAGIWDESEAGTLQGKLLGLLGVGSVGAHLAGTAHHFGMRVHGYTRHSEGCPYVDRYFHGDDLLEFAHGLDYLVCTLPGTPQTRGLVDDRFLKCLPSHAWLINVGRGTILDEAALVNALVSGQIAGAVLDVFNQEPLPPQHPFWHTPNTFITGHTAAISYPPQIAPIFIENYLRWLRNEPLKYIVDFQAGY